MADQPKFGLLRTLLKTLGLSDESVTELLDWIAALLTTESKDKTASPPTFPYRLRDDFLSPAEQSFFQVLRGVVGADVLICPKVRLADVLYVSTRDSSEYRIANNKIDRKHVDFLLCHAQTMTPMVGIELDDKSHARADRQERDHFVDQVFATAGLSLLHVPAQRGYVAQELVTLLRPHLSLAESTIPVLPPAVSPRAVAPPPPVAATPPTVAPTVEPPSPVCPKCGAPMLLRTAKSGKNQGQQFWGCSNYPSCRSMLAYAPDPATVVAH